MKEGLTKPAPLIHTFIHSAWPLTFFWPLCTVLYLEGFACFEILPWLRIKDNEYKDVSIYLQNTITMVDVICTCQITDNVLCT